MVGNRLMCCAGRLSQVNSSALRVDVVAKGQLENLHQEVPGRGCNVKGEE